MTAPWQGAQIDPDVALKEVRRLFPGVTVWAGEYTGSYWVLLDNQLHEFKDPHLLLAYVRAHFFPPPRPPRPSRSGTTRTMPSQAMTRGHRLGGATSPIGKHAAPSSHEKPDQLAALLDFPKGRWRRFLEGIRHFFLGNEDIAW